MTRAKLLFAVLSGLLVFGLTGGAAMLHAQGGSAPTEPKANAVPAQQSTSQPSKSPARDSSNEPNSAKPKPSSVPLAPGADTEAGPRPSPFEEKVKESGIKTCAKGVVGLGQAVVPPQSEFAAVFQWNKEKADGHAIQSLIGIRTKDENIAGVLFASPVAGACEGQFVRVTPVAGNCVAVAQGLNPKSALVAKLGHISVVLMPEQTQVMLIPAGDSCVVVLVGNAAS
jgi:hypothetical protein